MNKGCHFLSLQDYRRQFTVYYERQSIKAKIARAMFMFSNDLFGQPRIFSHLFQFFNLNYLMVPEVFKALNKKTKFGKDALKF